MKESADRVVALLDRLGRLIATDGHAEGLKPAQWEALRYLASANRFSRAPTALAAFLGSTKGTVSQTVQALERRRLVRKRPSPTDGRAVTLELTAAGKRMLEKDPIASIRDAAAALSASTRQRLETDLERLLLGRLAETDGRAFGMCRDCRHFEKIAEDGNPHRCALLEVPLSEDDASLICVEQEA